MSHAILYLDFDISRDSEDEFFVALLCGYKIFIIPITISMLVHINTHTYTHTYTSCIMKPRNRYLYIAIYFNVYISCVTLLNEWINAINYKFTYQTFPPHIFSVVSKIFLRFIVIVTTIGKALQFSTIINDSSLHVYTCLNLFKVRNSYYTRVCI